MKARESKGKPTKTGKASESRESKPKNFPRSPKHSKDARQKEKTPKKRPRNPRPSKILPKLTPNPAPNLPKSFQNPPQALPKAVQNPSFFLIDFWTQQTFKRKCLRTCREAKQEKGRENNRTQGKSKVNQRKTRES